MSSTAEIGGNDAAEEEVVRSPLPPLRFGGGLAARIVLLVLLVVVATGASAIAILGQVRDLRASFDLLTVVYVPFQERLARAQAQSAKIGAQVRPAGDPESQQVSRGYLLNFQEALEERASSLVWVRQPLEQAMSYPERIGGEERLEPIHLLSGKLADLEDLVLLDEEADPAEVLTGVSRQHEINQRFEELYSLGRKTLERQRDRVAESSRETQRFTLIVSILGALLSLIATFVVLVTLRPLRRLTENVRQLGSGDWSQRIEVGKRPEQDDEVSRLAREVNDMAAALEERERRLIRGERLAAVGRMASQITHEIRNPLSSVALNAELLEDELEAAGPEARQLLTRISSEVDRLTAITEAYLGLARRPKPELSAVRLENELHDLLDFLAEEHEQGGIEVLRSLPEEAIWVRADANQLRQAFINLLRNAQEAALCVEAGSGEMRRPEIRVHLEIDEEEREAVVVIGDTGPGIDVPAEQRERIFETFFTRKVHGTGLGLPTVQQIAVDHGGSVRVRSTGDEGTEFEFRLPLGG